MTRSPTTIFAVTLIAAAVITAIAGPRLAGNLAGLADPAKLAVFCLPALLALPGAWYTLRRFTAGRRGHPQAPKSAAGKIAEIAAITVSCCFVLPTAGAAALWLANGTTVNIGVFALAMAAGLILALFIILKSHHRSQDTIGTPPADSS